MYHFIYIFREYEISLSQKYAALSDDELDLVVCEACLGNRLIGPEAVRARLISKGMQVQRRRVRESMLRVDPATAAERCLFSRPCRRVYNVAGPNSLWLWKPQADHLDGNHKLIR